MTEAPERIVPPRELRLDPNDPAKANTRYIAHADSSVIEIRCTNPAIRDWIVAASKAPYVLASIADEHKRQRDRLLEAIKGLVEKGLSSDARRTEAASKAIAAIAECEGAD